MDIIEHIEHWKNQAESDLVVAENLFENGHYLWSLFVAHLVLEKILKALFIYRNNDIVVPRIHNLVKLAELSDVELPDDIKKFFFDVNIFQIESRYPEVKSQISQRINKQITENYLMNIREKYLWIKEQLK